MKRIKRKRKKGFTLVELLAVVVILGIILMISIPVVGRWIDRSKAESDEGNKKTLVMAAQSYAQGDSKKLPKVVGGSTTVTAQELKDANFLKEDLVNSDKKSCMDSYVRIVKTSKGQYKYTAYIYCDGDTIMADTSVENPIISIAFIGDKNEDDIIDDVSIAGFRITIEGGNTSSKKYMLTSYSYSISVRYNNSDKIVEIYNTGNVETGQIDRVVIERSLSDYVDITKVNDFIITVEAYNSVGGYRKQTLDSAYKDTVPPKCGKITGQAQDENDWLTVEGDTRTISVLCSDGNGSGCVKDKYTRTFDSEIENSVITISDNAGNTTDCPVRVNIDWTRPTLLIIAYKRNANGTSGAEVGRVTADHPNAARELRQYTDNANGWLNRAKFPNGVNYVITTTDNVHIYRGEWEYNAPNIFKINDPNLLKFTKSTSSEFSFEHNTVTLSFTDEGLRRGRYTLRDRALNKVLVNITADIDKTDPRIKANKDNIGSTSGLKITISCSDDESGCTETSYVKNNVKSTASYSVSDRADNTNSISVSVTAYNCNCSSCHHRENTCKGGNVPKSGYQYCPFAGGGSGVSCGSGPPDGNAWLVCGTCTYNVWDSCATGGPNECVYGCDTCYK